MQIGLTQKKFPKEMSIYPRVDKVTWSPDNRVAVWFNAWGTVGGTGLNDLRWTEVMRVRNMNSFGKDGFSIMEPGIYPFRFRLAESSGLEGAWGIWYVIHPLNRTKTSTRCVDVE